MSTKTFTLTAEVEYDPTSTSPESMVSSFFSVMQDAMDTDLVDAHGELFLHSCDVKEEVKEEEKSSKLFEGEEWTSRASQLANRIRREINPIAKECQEEGLDLRHAIYIAQHEVSTAFLQVIMDERFAIPKKDKAS